MANIFMSESDAILSDAILMELANRPCGDLASVARRVLTGERKANVPGVACPVRFRMFRRKNKKMGGFFIPGLVSVFLNRRGPLATLIHEMRHAQQLAALGSRRFYDTLDAHPDPLLDPLEIDAFAAEIACGTQKPGKSMGKVGSWECVKGMPRKQVAAVRRVAKMIEEVYARQARAIGKGRGC